MHKRIILFLANIPILYLLKTTGIQKMGTLARNALTQPAIACPKLTIETLEQSMKYIQN